MKHKKFNKKIVMLFIVSLLSISLAYADGWNNNLAHHETLYADVLTSKDDVDLVTVSDPDGFEVFTNAYFATSGVGNVGIGTAAPGARLDVTATGMSVIRATAGDLNYAALLIGDNGVNSYGLKIQAGNNNAAGRPLLVNSYDDATTYMVINGLGNVGIGTAVPAGIFHVTADGASSSYFERHSTDGSAPAMFFRKSRGTAASPLIIAAGDDLGLIAGRGYDGAGYIDAAQILFESDNTPGVNDMPGRISFWTTPDGSATLAERMRIDSSGNVGIGTTAPGAKLSFGTFSGSGAIHLYDSGGAGSYGFGIQSSELQSFVASGGHFSFNSGGSLQTSGTNELVRIMSTGNVGIGTSSPGVLAGSDASLALQLHHASGFPGTYFSTESTANDAVLGELSFGTTGTAGAEKRGAAVVSRLSAASGTAVSGRLELYTTDAGTIGERMRIDEKGNVGIGTTNPVNKFSVVSGVGTITKSTSDNDKYRPVITGGSKGPIPDNVQISLFQVGYDAVFTLHIVAFIDENNQMSQVYNVHVLYGSPLITEVSTHSYGAGVSSIGLAYVNADRTIRATVDTNAGQSTTVYWSVYGLGFRNGDGTFDIQ